MVINLDTIMRPDPIRKKNKSRFTAIVSDKVRDYGNEPYFVKKAQDSKEFLTKHGFPKELLDKK